MPQTKLINDFSAGWCPADDPINGRKNGLLKMDSVELDQNGALRLQGGSQTLVDYSVTPALNAHTIFTKFLSTGQFRYVTFSNGATYRGTTSIVTSGSTTRTAFGSAFDYVIICSGSQRKKDTGASVSDLGVTAPSAKPTVAASGGGVLTGTYQYYQVNVVKNGAYVAQSGVSPISDAVSPSANAVNVTPNTFVAGQTHAWIFRKGNTLDDWYRVAEVTSAALFSDNLSDSDALDLSKILDSIFQLSVNSTDLPDDILEVVGPLNGRMGYITKNTINFSLPSSPDSYIPGQSIPFAGGLTGSELFLFARKISDNLVIIGTTKDFYLLGGTFITLPDGTLDVYLRSLSVENPPISIDADIYNGNIVCMTAAGWKLTSISGQQTKITDTRTDRLYRGETLQGYGGIPIVIIPQYRYSCAVIRDKLFVRVPQIVGNNPATTYTYRMECYDFKRQYWRPLTYNPLMIFGNEDDSLIGFFGISHLLRSLDDPFVKTNIDINQTVNLLFSVIHCDTPRNRKDIYGIKFKINTGGSDLNVLIYDETGTNLLKFYTINTATLSEVDIDTYADLGVLKSFLLNLSGNVADFLLCDISLDYDVRPDQVSNVMIVPNLGPNKKRIRTQSFKIDNLNTDVICTPYVDGVAGIPVTFAAAAYEKTFLYQFKTDVFGVDYKFKLHSTGVFELYPTSNPDIAQILPVAKQFEQLGPLELFRYGQLKEFEIRILPFGTTIPVTFYFEDGTSDTENVTVVNGIDQMATINLPKNVEGSVLRIELGPTNFDFHLFYGRVKTQKKGKDTEIEWITIQPEQAELAQ